VLASAHTGTRLSVESTVERPALVPLGSSFSLTEL
jgi:hypothetical protein